MQESSGRAELQEHALAKLKARERGASLGPMVSIHTAKTVYRKFETNIPIKGNGAASVPIFTFMFLRAI
jgi:hypothetical protein